jgi:hypothetical protein
MPLVAARNVAIILAISAGVYFLPGGGTAAAVVSSAVFTAFSVALCWVAVMLYRRYRGDLMLLGDQGRAMLYGGIGALFIAGAGARTMFQTPAGAVIWVALVVAALYAFLVLWRRRQYG